MEPRAAMAAWLVVLAVGGLYTPLPAHLIVDPRWALFIVVILLLVPTVVSHFRRLERLNQVLGFAVGSVVTLGLIASVVLLISDLPQRREASTELLLYAAVLWATNILVFALWYWRLDAGGPHSRDRRKGHDEGAFFFPQMTLSPDSKIPDDPAYWTPKFVDYLFLAFNTSTAFSPTDVPVLTRWARS